MNTSTITIENVTNNFFSQNLLLMMKTAIFDTHIFDARAREIDSLKTLIFE